MGMERSPSTILTKTELTGTRGKEILVILNEVAPDSTGSRHYHPGDEVVYILEGSITFTLDGKPDVTLKAGETCHIPAKQVHFGKTASASVKFLSIQVQETGTPRRRLEAE
jgi:quercetin dioxygenase-like cupin family protein